MWQLLSTAIVNTINNAALIDGKRVFDYAKTQMDNYPCITVCPAENNGTAFADTARNQRNYVFSIRVFQERTTVGSDQSLEPEQQSEVVMRSLVDNLISLFDADPYLQNTLAGKGFARPIPSVWKFITGEQINTRMAEILLVCVVIE